jgi:hypothetical protein
VALFSAPISIAPATWSAPEAAPNPIPEPSTPAFALSAAENNTAMVSLKKRIIIWNALRIEEIDRKFLLAQCLMEGSRPLIVNWIGPDSLFFHRNMVTRL